MAVAWKSLLLLGLLMTSFCVNAQDNSADNSADAGDAGSADAGTADDTSGQSGQQLNEAGSSASSSNQTTQAGCYQQAQPSTMQVFMALLEPVTAPSDPEAAQDAPRGMVTMYVDQKSGQAYVIGSVNNIQNLTAVTLNAGNSTQVGPVILPLLPSASRVQQSPQASAAAGNNSQSQGGNSQSQSGGANSISPFAPPLPWVTAMEFSERVALSDLLPLTSNATLNVSANTPAGGASGSAGGNANQPAAQRAPAGGNVPLNQSGNLVGARPFSYVNVTDLNRQLSNRGMVTVMTVYMEDGTTITSFNISNSTQGSSGQANNQGVVSPVPLMQAGLAYVSVHTSQSGQGPELRGQLMPYGKVVGNSAVIANSFPDVLMPKGQTYTTVCNNATSASSSANASSSNATTTPAAISQESGTRAQNQSNVNLLNNNTWTNQAAQAFPAVRTAMTNVTSNARNLNGSYAIFSALAQAAETAINKSQQAAGGNAGGSASGNAGNAGGSASGSAGRRLLQQATASSSATASNGNASSNSGGNAGNASGNAGGAEKGAASGNAGGSASGSAGGNAQAGTYTVFAPSDKAIQTYLQQQGLTQQQFLSNQPALLQLISYHIVPNQALTAQQLASRGSGAKLQTLLPNNDLGVNAFGYQAGGNNSQVVLLQDAVGTANVRDPNMSTGKVVVHGIDKVLVPQSTQNKTQAAGGAGGSAGGSAANNGAAGGASANVGDNSAGVSGNASPNDASADVQTSDNSDTGSRRLMRRLFMLAHNAHLL